MSGISLARCRNHHLREAAARCTDCGGYFCRECIVEHRGRMLCARCLPATAQRAQGGRLLPAAMDAFRAAAGLLLLWFIFYQLGKILLLIGSSQGTGSFLGIPLSE